MFGLVLALLVAVASAQEIPAVRLARPGSFSGGRPAGSGEFQVNNFQESFQQGNQNAQLVSSSLDALSENNQFVSGFEGQERVAAQVQNRQFQGGDSEGIVNGVFEPLNLPSGASLLMGQIDTSFQCADRPYGFYADQGNACRVFHVCNPYLFSDGRIEAHQYSFMCGEGQIFDQKEMTCADQFAALSCEEAANFYFRNEEFGRPEEKF